jgi:hypothetical protein
MLLYPIDRYLLVWVDYLKQSSRVFNRETAIELRWLLIICKDSNNHINSLQKAGRYVKLLRTARR